MSNMRPYGLLNSKEKENLKHWERGFEVFTGTKWRKTDTVSPERVYRLIYTEPTIEAFENAPTKADTVIIEDDFIIKFHDSNNGHTFSEVGENEGWEPGLRIKKIDHKYVYDSNENIVFMEKGIHAGKELPTCEEIHKQLNDLKVGDNVIMIRNFSCNDFANVSYGGVNEDNVNKLYYVDEVKKAGLRLNNGINVPFWCLEKVDFCPECNTELGENNEHLF